MTKIKTLCFTWENISGKIWAAKDPCDSGRRWIIRPCDSNGINYECLWVRFGIFNKVTEKLHLRAIMWFVVGYRLQQLAEDIYAYKYLALPEEVDNAHKLFNDMTEEEQDVVSE